MSEPRKHFAEVVALHRAAQTADERLLKAFGELDVPLTPRQAVVLEAISQHDGCNQTTLVEVTGVDRSTMTDIVRRLTDRDLVKRNRTRNDARSYALHLSMDGIEALAAARRADASVAAALSALVREVAA